MNERPPDAPWMAAPRLLTWIGVRLWLVLFHRLEIHGREHLPRRGSFVMVANHRSHLDALALMAALPARRVLRTHPVAAADYFFRDRLRAWFFALTVNALPFDRHKRSARGIDRCRALLRSDERVLVLFPEGTRGEGTEVGRFRCGIGRVVVGTDVPVVPCHLSGAERALPKGRWLPRPVKLILRIAPPRRYGNLPATREAARWIGDDLRSAVVRSAASALAGGESIGGAAPVDEASVTRGSAWRPREWAASTGGSAPGAAHLRSRR